MSGLIHYKIEGEGLPIILIHGLFGSLDNLGILARDLRQHYQIISIDLRNHGLSFHSDEHNYQNMAEDVIALLDHLKLDKVSIIGHSMGGKTAMKLASLDSKRVTSLVVLDMAPIHYTKNRHDDVFAGIELVDAQRVTSRKEALETLAQRVKIEGVRQFLGKSLYKDAHGIMQWRFNASSLKQNYPNILGWDPIEPVATPTLFVKGGDSEYIISDYQSQIVQQFPNAKAHIIANTGHWLHAEKPQEVLRAIYKFYDRN
ncbi:alpha/beta fold hydrolase [Vibrio sp.]|nr:alpha/beta fold hydrolase [Vibrio sp.]